MSYLQAVRLVAVREMVERARSRTFIISLAISMISVVVVVLVSAFVISGKGKSVSMRLEGATTSLEQPLQAAASQANLDLHFQAAQGSDADAAAVRKGDVDAALGGDPAQPTVTVQQTLDPTFTAVLQSITRQIQIQEHFQAAGLSPSQASTVLQATPPKVVSLQSGDRDLDARKTAAFIGGLLLYMSLLFGGFAVAGGVVSEKSGRVVELLLATLRPAQMLAGKVLGIGAISLLQFALIIGTGVVTSLVVGSARIPSSVLVAAPQTLLWFVLGFLFYSVLYAAAGALAQRFEDLQSVTLPFTLFLPGSWLRSHVSHPEHPRRGLRPLRLVLSPHGTVDHAATRRGGVGILVGAAPCGCAHPRCHRALPARGWADIPEGNSQYGWKTALAAQPPAPWRRGSGGRLT